MTDCTRREFTVGAALAAGGALAAHGMAAEPAPAAARNSDAAPLNVGVIGLGNRGDQVHDAFLQQPDVRIAAVCDMYEPYLDFAAKKVREKQNHDPFRTRDYHELLKRDDVRAVVICTPDHWHGVMAADALLAGKDVYVEKPLGIKIAEGRRLVELGKKTGRVAQVGIQRKSSAMCREVVERIQAGEIGRVSVVRCFHVQNETPRGIGRPADGAPPRASIGTPGKAPRPSMRITRIAAFIGSAGSTITRAAN
ncbi:MAG: Gfo/Idh/MocA family oxidoreductase [Pirellulales bacterium]